MKIKSKNTGILHDVTKDEWLGMKNRGDSRHYTVVDDSDDHFQVREIKVEPIELISDDVEAQKEDTVSYNDDMAKELDEEGEIGFYRNFLDEKGVYYHPNTGIEKLKKKYEENLWTNKG